MTDRIVIRQYSDHIVEREGLHIVQAGVMGPPGPPGPQGLQGQAGIDGVSDSQYVHNQIAASTIWTITHNLGKFPAITVVDSGDNVVFGSSRYIDANTVEIEFTSLFSGKAYLN